MILTKHLTSEKVGFDASNLTYASLLIYNVIVFIIALFYWYETSNFHLDSFWIGMAGSIVSGLAIVFIQNAIAKGPAGPVLALTS